jgi:hypothetical protein
MITRTMRAVVTGLALVALLLPSMALAKGGGGRGSKGWTVTVRPYTKKDGTQVEGHHRSGPDGSKNNNWSTKGNVNPYTGKPGTKEP